MNSKDFLAAGCDCKAGCKNDGPNLGEHRVICTHSMMVLVQLSQLMFCGTAEHILVNFHRHIQREDIHGYFDDACDQRVRDDIVQLIKATGKRPPTLEVGTSILEMLENYAETTGHMRMSPGEPKARDLGLLHGKVKYSQPITKAEKTTMQNKDVAICDVGIGAGVGSGARVRSGVGAGIRLGVGAGVGSGVRAGVRLGVRAGVRSGARAGVGLGARAGDG